MNEIRKKYGLRHKKTSEIVTYNVTSNAGCDSCGDTTTTLGLGISDQMWVVDTPRHAEWVRLNSTEWYNADYDTPVTRDLEPKELEVVQIDVVIKVEKVDIKIPTMLELFEARYAKSDPGHFEYLKKLIEEGEIKGYSYYDLLDTFPASQSEDANKVPDKENKS